MLALSSITLDGTPLPFAEVAAEVTIRHGRTGYFDSASASTAQVTLLGVTSAFSREITLGGTLIINATDGTTDAPRFTGRTTDANIDGENLTLIAVGFLSQLSGYLVGGAAYPEEAWTARVARIFTEAGLSSRLQLQTPKLDPVLLARAAESVALASYLSELAEMIGASLADTPDGKILVQPVSFRSYDGQTDLDPATVAYAPQWIQQLPGGNRVTLKYGSPETSVFREDTASVSRYGPRPVERGTEIKTSADAAAVADAIVARQAWARWTTPETALLHGMRLQIGAPVELSNLPDSTPFDPWTSILEGWTDEISSDGTTLQWTMLLALSDPLLSGIGFRWQDVDPANTWANINQETEWREALSPGSLEP